MLALGIAHGPQRCECWAAKIGIQAREDCPDCACLLLGKSTVSNDGNNLILFGIGELAKVLGTIAVLAVAQRYYDVHWLTMLVGLFAALKANLFAFLLKI